MAVSIKTEPIDTLMPSGSICSDDHFDVFSREASNMRTSSIMTDYVITAAGDKQLFAHKFMLSCMSPVVRNSPHYELDLSQFNSDVIDALISFVYNGDVRIGLEHLDGLLAAGALLEIPGLVATNQINDDKPPPTKKSPVKRKRSTSETNGSPKKSKAIATDTIEKFPKQAEEFIRSPEDNTFVCNYCYRPFTSKGGVIQHVLLHTGEAQKHGCFHCSYETRQKCHLKVHCKKMHDMQGPTFEIVFKKRQEKLQAEKDNDVDDDPMPGPSAVKDTTRVKTEPKEKPQEDDAAEPPTSKADPKKKTSKTGAKKESRSASSKFASRVKKEPKDQTDANER